MIYDSWCSRCGVVTAHSLGSCLRCLGQVSRQDGALSQDPAPQAPIQGEGSAQSAQRRSASQGRPHALGQAPRVGVEAPRKPTHTRLSHAAEVGAHGGAPRRTITAPITCGRRCAPREHRCLLIAVQVQAPSRAGNPGGSEARFGSLGEARSQARNPSAHHHGVPSLPACGGSAIGKGRTP